VIERVIIRIEQGFHKDLMFFLPITELKELFFFFSFVPHLCPHSSVYIIGLIHSWQFLFYPPHSRGSAGKQLIN